MGQDDGRYEIEGGRSGRGGSGVKREWETGMGEYNSLMVVSRGRGVRGDIEARYRDGG